MKILKSLAIALAAISSTQAVELTGAAQLDSTRQGCQWMYDGVCISKDCFMYCLEDRHAYDKNVPYYCTYCLKDDVGPKKQNSFF